MSRHAETPAFNSPRVAVVERVQRYLLPLADIDYERLHTQELTADESVPTIGAEIEIPWSARFPEYSQILFAKGSYADLSEEEKRHFSALCNELDARYLPLYEAVTRLGVPRDKNQKFWEFAHSPVRHYKTLATEISLLTRGGLLPEGYDVPLHITLGGLRGGSGGYFLQMMAEIIGGSSAERIRSPIGTMPIYERKWARKAPDGLKERKGFELRGANCGFEMRTFIFTSARQVKNVLKTCQLLGLALGHARRSSADEPHNPDLTQSWKEAVNSVKQVEEVGVRVSKAWQGPAEDPGTWSRYAEFLEHDGVHSQLKTDITKQIEHITDEIAEIAAEAKILCAANDEV